MPGLDPGILDLKRQPNQSGGWPGQARPWRPGGVWNQRPYRHV